VGLFERTKHLERLAREIADQNLRQLGVKAQPADQEKTRRQILELEAVLREYRLHLDEADARRELAVTREQAAQEKAHNWIEKAAFAREKKRPDLSEQAAQRAAVYQRERETAAADKDHHVATIARLRTEIVEVERRIEVLRALRRGEAPQSLPGPATRRGTSTTRISFPPRDPLEEAFDQLRDS
jgi:hypothetical protein